MRSVAEGVRLRQAGVADAPAIGALHVAAWRAAYQGIFPDDMLAGLSVEQFGERHRKRLLEPDPADAHVWVAESPRGIIGFTIGGSARDADLPSTAGEVYAIYLLPEALGRGVGRALFAQSLSLLGAQGKIEVIVWVGDANARARRFYEAAGLTLDPAAAPKSVVFQGRDIGVASVRMRGPLASRP